MKTITVNMNGLTDRKALCAAIGEAVAEEPCGKNLDALHDVLTDITADTELVLVNTAALKLALGDYAEKLFRMLTDTVAENPHLTVTLA